MAIRIRDANGADAKELAAIAEATFRDTFAAHNTPADMDLHCRRSFGEPIQAAEIASSAMTTLIAEIHGRMAGFAQLRWGGAPACVGGKAPGEIQRLYVERDFHGKGVAQALMQRCLEAIAVHGCDIAWLGVWERNARARAFYAKFGFREAGEHVFVVGTDRQRDIIVTRAVSRVA